MGQFRRAESLNISADYMNQMGKSEEARKLLSLAIREFDSIEIPFQQIKELCENLQLIGKVGDSYDEVALWGINFARDDSLRYATYEHAVTHLGFEESWQQFEISYPPVNVYGPEIWDAVTRVDVYKSFAVTYKAHLHMLTCLNVECYFEAIELLEASLQDRGADEAEILCYLGMLHYVCDNETSSCRAIKKACELDGERQGRHWNMYNMLTEGIRHDPTMPKICSCENN